MGESEPRIVMRDLWDGLAATGPLEVIIPPLGQAGGRWGIRDFFEQGEKQVAGICNFLEGRGVLRFPQMRALDFGCGVGRLTRALAKRAHNVVGLDISPAMLRHAGEIPGCPENITFIQGDEGCSIPLESGSVDFATCFAVLVHLPPDRAVHLLSEFMRVLRPGGVLYFNYNHHFTVHEREGLSRREWVAEQGYLPPGEGERAMAEIDAISVSDKNMGAHFSFSREDARFPMYAIPRRIVEGALSKGGGEVLVAEPVIPRARRPDYTFLTIDDMNVLVRKSADSGGPLVDGTV